jgi:hypothetical protein
MIRCTAVHWGRSLNTPSSAKRTRSALRNADRVTRRYGCEDRDVDRRALICVAQVRRISARNEKGKLLEYTQPQATAHLADEALHDAANRFEQIVNIESGRKPG